MSREALRRTGFLLLAFHCFKLFLANNAFPSFSVVRPPALIVTFQRTIMRTLCSIVRYIIWLTTGFAYLVFTGLTVRPCFAFKPLVPRVPSLRRAANRAKLPVFATKKFFAAMRTYMDMGKVRVCHTIIVPYTSQYVKLARLRVEQANPPFQDYSRYEI